MIESGRASGSWVINEEKSPHVSGRERGKVTILEYIQNVLFSLTKVCTQRKLLYQSLMEMVLPEPNHMG